MDRAIGCGPIGRGFESLRARIYFFSSFDFSDFVLSHICILPLNKNEPTITVTRPTTTNIIPLPMAPNFDNTGIYEVFIKNFCEIIMYTRKDVAIWIAILGGGIGFFLFYGIAVDLMR